VLRSLVRVFVTHSVSSSLHDTESRRELPALAGFVESIVALDPTTDRDAVTLELTGEGLVEVAESMGAEVAMDASALHRLLAWLTLLLSTTAFSLWLARSNLVDVLPVVYLPATIPAALLVAIGLPIPKLQVFLHRVLDKLVRVLRLSPLVTAATLAVSASSLVVIFLFGLLYLDHALFERQLASLKGFTSTEKEDKIDDFKTFLHRYPERPETWTLLVNRKEFLSQRDRDKVAPFLEQVLGTGPGTGSNGVKPPETVLKELHTLCEGRRLGRHLWRFPAPGVANRFAFQDCYRWAIDAIKPTYRPVRSALPEWKAAIANLDDGRKCLADRTGEFNTIKSSEDLGTMNYAPALRQISRDATTCPEVLRTTDFLNLMNQLINLASILCVENSDKSMAFGYQKLVYELLGNLRAHLSEMQIHYSGPRNIAILAWLGTLFVNDSENKQYQKFQSCFKTKDQFVNGADSSNGIAKSDLSANALSKIWYQGTMRIETPGDESELTALLNRFASHRWGY